MLRLFILFITLFSTLFGNAQNKKQRFIRENIEFTQQQLVPLKALDPEKDGYPRTVHNGKLRCTFRKDWTEGFFPGSLL